MLMRVILALLVVVSAACASKAPLQAIPVQPAPLALSADQSTLPLVQSQDAQYLGYFTLPMGPDAIAVDGSTVYASFGTCIRSFTLPALGGQAQSGSACMVPPNLDTIHPTDRNVIVGGIFPYLGKFVVSAYVYYDGSAGATRSHWSGPTLSSLSGPYTVTTATSVPPGQLGVPERPGMVGGGMGIIPPEWRASLGGPALTGLCCVPIISRSSHGPSAWVFDPATIDGRPVVPAKALVVYPIEHRTPLRPTTAGRINSAASGSRLARARCSSPAGTATRGATALARPTRAS
jgi:hypothetical protein